MKKYRTPLSVNLWEYTSHKQLRRVWERVPGVTFPARKEPEQEPEKEKDDVPEGYMDANGAADFFNVESNTFYNIARKHNLPFTKGGRNNRKMYRISDLEKLKKELKTPKNPKN